MLTKVRIYTDGACSYNPGPGGWACVLICGEHRKEISGYAENTTNNRMELQACIEGLRSLKRACQVSMFCDSNYVVQAFNCGWIESWQKKKWLDKGELRKNYDLWQELLALTQLHQVEWCKVKGHADDDLNNRCDELARRAIREGNAK